MTPINESDSAQSSSDFDRFKDFARRIVAVPKAEIDELAQKQAAQKPESKKEKRGSR